MKVNSYELTMNIKLMVKYGGGGGDAFMMNN